MRRIKHVCPLSLGRFDRGLACTCRGEQQPSLPALHGQVPPVHAVHATKRWHCKYLWYANPYSAWRRCILLLSAIHSQPPGPSSPPMFHVSTCCSPTIANVEAAQFERSCTKQLIIHQSGSNAQVPLLDHVSVRAISQPFSHSTRRPLQHMAGAGHMAPRPVGPSPADRLCTCKSCSRLSTGHGSKGLGLELEIEI